MSVTRRTMLGGGLGLGLACCLPRSAAGQGGAAAVPPKKGDVLVKASDAEAHPLTPKDVPTDAPLLAWAMDPADRSVRSGSRLNQIVLMRIDESKLAGETRARAAEGVVAYSAICTHQGCQVVDWNDDQQALSCPCHDSVFDAKDDGKVLDGPAPRMLPALPLSVVDGRLVIAGPFTAPPGFS